MATSDISRRIRTGSALNIKYAVQNLIDIYKDNWDYIIDQELRDQVSQETYDKFQWLITKELNIVKRVVKELSTVYKEPPERKAVISDEQTDDNYDSSQKDTSKDIVLQSINAYTNLVNHTLLKVTYRDDKLDYDQINFNNAETFYSSTDWMKMVAVKHYMGYRFPGELAHAKQPQLKLSDSEGLAAGSVQNYTEAKVWVSEDISALGIIENDDYDTLAGGYVYTVKTVGDVEVIVSKEEIVYKDADGKAVLPFVLYSKTYPVDDMLDFTTGNDLRDLNINVSIMMIWINSLVKYQSFKQLVFNTDDPDSIQDDMRLGPAEVLVNPTREGNGDVQVLDLQAKVLELFDLVKHRIFTSLSGYGVSPDNFTLSADAQSGFALQISNMGKMESRQAQIPTYNTAEKKIFNIERVIWNYHKPNEKIADEAELVIDFAEPTYPQSAEEKVKSAEFGLMHNIITEIDLLMRHNPDLTEEQAEELYAKNKAFNEANKKTVTITPATQPGQPVEEVEDAPDGQDNT